MGPPSRAPERTQRERTEATTAELLAAARRLFAADGYQATSLDGIVAAAGVTKGALYHHFGSKRDLFHAVFERERKALAVASRAAYDTRRDPWEGFYESCRAFLEAVLDPGVQRIALLDGPAVLDPEAVRAVQARYGLVPIEDWLERAIASGRIAPRPVAPLAAMLFGALCEGAKAVAHSAGDQRSATRELLREVRTMLAWLETAPERDASARGRPAKR